LSVAEDSYPSGGRAAGVLIDAETEALWMAYVPDGIIGTPADPYPVYCSGDASRGIRFRANTPVMFRGIRWIADADVIKSADANPASQARLDLVCLELDHAADNQLRAKVVTGTAGSSTGPTPLTDAVGGVGKVQYPLGWVEIAPGAVSMTNAAVRRRGVWLGTDGRLITSTTSVRPTPLAGRLATEYESGDLILGNGVGWLSIAGDTGPLPVVTGNANGCPDWNIPSSGYGAMARRKGGRVTLVLEVQRGGDGSRPGGTLAANTDSFVAKVPAGMEPPTSMYRAGVPIYAFVGNNMVRGAVQSSGKVQIRDYAATIPNGTNLTFESVSWEV
jgi:hypothetical protein